MDSYTSTSLEEGISRLNDADRVVMHNGIGFDHPALAKFGYNFPIDKIYDTLVASRLVDPTLEGGHSLRAWGERLGFPKGEYEDWSKLSDEMIEYCKQDCQVTLKLYEKIHPIAEIYSSALALEHKVAQLIAQQERNGFGFDVSKAEELAATLYAERKDVEYKLQDIFPPIWKPSEIFTPVVDNKRLGYSKGCDLTKVDLQVFNPSSRQQIANRLINKYDWKPKKFTPSGQPEINEGTLSTLKYPEAKELHKYLRIDKMIGMLGGEKGWLRMVKNGRIYGSVNPCGARTGRMTHRNPNVAQADSDPRMRELFIPRKGWKLLGVDADGLEARLLGHYLAKLDDGEFADRVVNGDFHSFNQQICELDSRHSSKTLFYAYMYGAGDGKIGQIVYDDRKYKGAKVAKGRATRKKLSEGIKGLGALSTNVRMAASERGYLLGLDKRHIQCPSPHTALNTLIQGAGAIVMKKALTIFAEDTYDIPSWGYCANVHDEIQIEAHEDEIKTLAFFMVNAIKEAGKQLQLRCQMDGSYKIGNNWSETH